MKILLLISWFYNGVIIDERWSFNTMQECIETAFSVEPRYIHTIACTRVE